MTGTKTLTRAEILGAQDIKVETVKVPEWGGSVNVQAMTGAARDEYEEQVLTTRERDPADGVPKNWRAILVSLTVVDDAGKRMFTPADVEALGAKNGTAMTRVVTVAMRLSGLREQDAEKISGN